MKTPYIRVTQKNEVFFITKFKAIELKKYVHFHVRDPYKESGSVMSNKYEQFIHKLESKNIKFSSSDKEVQRRLTLSRVNEIKKFIETSGNFLPNTVILSVDITNEFEFQHNYLKYENEEIGYFDFNENAEFMIVDGQHRLAGIFSIEDNLLSEIEVPAIMLFNVSLSTAAKLFADINGKVKPVNRSLIYDLYEEINDINDVEYELIKKIHLICKAFYENINSPLYRQIKMLGIGQGAISQAFFIDYVKQALKVADLLESDIQLIFNHLFYYFYAFQEIFPNDWPVKRNASSIENEEHAVKVLKVKKSQLVKTNGFGAIMKLFPDVYAKILNNNSTDLYYAYLNIIRKLEDKIDWASEEYQGTGKKFQNSIYENLKKYID